MQTTSAIVNTALAVTAAASCLYLTGDEYDALRVGARSAGRSDFNGPGAVAPLPPYEGPAVTLDGRSVTIPCPTRCVARFNGVPIIIVPHAIGALEGRLKGASAPTARAALAVALCVHAAEDLAELNARVEAALAEARVKAPPSAADEIAAHLTEAASRAAAGNVDLARCGVFAAACVAAREAVAAPPGSSSNQDWGARLGALQALAARMAA